MQSSKGIIKSMEIVGTGKVLDSMTSNILQILQSAIHLKKLKKNLE